MNNQGVFWNCHFMEILDIQYPQLKSDRFLPLAKKITKPPNDIRIGSFRQNPNLSCGYCTSSNAIFKHFSPKMGEESVSNDPKN